MTYFKMYAAFLFNIIIVILHTNTDNLPVLLNSDNTAVTMTKQEQRPGKILLTLSFIFNCSVQQERQCVHMHKETHKCNMRTPMHSHIRAHVHTWTIHTPFILQLIWVLENLVLTCCSDDSSTATQRCPLSLPAAPSFTLMSWWVDNIITHHVTT